MVLILDADGRLEYINESFTKLNNITIDELKSRYGDTIYQLSNNPQIREIIEEAVTQKRSVSYESLNKKAEAGREIWESSTLTPIFDEHNKHKKIIIIDTLPSAASITTNKPFSMQGPCDRSGSSTRVN